MDLRAIPLFAGLSDEDCDALQTAVRTVHQPQGSRVFEEGDAVRGFYLVRRGIVKIFKMSPSGNEQVLSIVPPGQSFAEATVFQGTRYPASAECLQDSELLFIERDAIRRQLEHDPNLSLRMMAGMAMKLRRLVQLVEDLTLRDARGRICRYLAGLLPAGADAETTLRLPVQQALVARLLGITSETLSRTLKSLREDGLIELEGRGRIRVPDPRNLREAAGDVEH